MDVVMNLMKRIVPLMCMALAASAQGRVLRVNNSAGMAAGYATLADAVAAASTAAVDTIHLEGSLTPYTGNVTVNKKLVIAGPGYFLTSAAETQYGKEPARLDCDLAFDAGSEGSVLAGVTQREGASGFSVNTASYAGNRVIVKTSDISIVSCKLFFVEINSPQPLSNIAVKQCFFNPGAIVATGAGTVSNLTVTNCFFRNDGSGYRVIAGAAGAMTGWRISQNTFYYSFSVTVENSVLANNVFYAQSAAAGTVNASATNAYTDNVMRFATGGMTNGVDRNVIPPTTVDENRWFSKTGQDAAIDAYYTAASTTTDCPLRDSTDPGSDSKAKGMYGGGAPYARSGMYAIPSVYDIVMDAEVGDSFNMTVKARTH
jgi:hypothetical protein